MDDPKQGIPTRYNSNKGRAPKRDDPQQWTTPNKGWHQLGLTPTKDDPQQEIDLWINLAWKILFAWVLAKDKFTKRKTSLFGNKLLINKSFVEEYYYLLFQRYFLKIFLLEKN